jgi:hypothetical protein
VAVRRHREGDIGTMPVAEFRELAMAEVAEKRQRLSAGEPASG